MVLSQPSDTKSHHEAASRKSRIRYPDNYANGKGVRVVLKDSVSLFGEECSLWLRQ